MPGPTQTLGRSDMAPPITPAVGTDGRTRTTPEAVALLHQAQAGDIEAFATPYSTYRGLIGRYVYVRTHDRDAADDLVYDTFTAALIGLPTDDDDVVGWLLHLAARACTRHVWGVRRQRRAAHELHEQPLPQAGARPATRASWRPPRWAAAGKPCDAWNGAPSSTCVPRQVSDERRPPRADAHDGDRWARRASARPADGCRTRRSSRAAPAVHLRTGPDLRALRDGQPQWLVPRLGLLLRPPRRRLARRHLLPVRLQCGLRAVPGRTLRTAPTGRRAGTAAGAGPPGPHRQPRHTDVLVAAGQRRPLPGPRRRTYTRPGNGTAVMTEPAPTLAQILAAHTEVLPAVALHDGTHRRGVILGFDDSGHIELDTDAIALPVDPDTPAELITRPPTRAWLLTEALATNRRTYLWLSGERRQERERVSTARHERGRLLDKVRAYLIACVDAGQLDRSQINEFLRRHHQQPYQPRLHVFYALTRR